MSDSNFQSGNRYREWADQCDLVALALDQLPSCIDVGPVMIMQMDGRGGSPTSFVMVSEGWDNIPVPATDIADPGSPPAIVKIFHQVMFARIDEDAQIGN